MEWIEVPGRPRVWRPQAQGTPFRIAKFDPGYRILRIGEGWIDPLYPTLEAAKVACLLLISIGS